MNHLTFKLPIHRIATSIRRIQKHAYATMMRAMVLNQPRTPLQLQKIPIPKPLPNQILIKVTACGVCRTDLHVVDHDLKEPKLPLVPGHQIVGIVETEGNGFKKGQRVGVPWLGWSCGDCSFCNHDQENLCDHAKYTGYQIDGGFAEYCVVDSRFCFPIPEGYPDIQAAPLLCAGLIGYRSYQKTGKNVKRIGLYGFGSAAHILTQVCLYNNQQVYAFTRKGDVEAQNFAKKLGAIWAGDSTQLPPEELDAAILFAPDGSTLPAALRAVRKGGAVICGGIHMSDIPSFPYSILWGERRVESVANLTRRDAIEFLELAPKVPVKTEVHEYPLEKANEALDDLRHGRFTGSAVILI